MERWRSSGGRKELTDGHTLKEELALDGVAQWIDCLPENRRVSVSIPSQGTCLGCGPGPH